MGLSTETLKKLQKELQTLRNSCIEGYDGTWDPSGEGADGFMAMAHGIDRIADTLSIELEETECG